MAVVSAEVSMKFTCTLDSEEFGVASRHPMGIQLRDAIRTQLELHGAEPVVAILLETLECIDCTFVKLDT